MVYSTISNSRQQSCLEQLALLAPIPFCLSQHCVLEQDCAKLQLCCWLGHLSQAVRFPWVCAVHVQRPGRCDAVFVQAVPGARRTCWGPHHGVPPGTNHEFGNQEVFHPQPVGERDGMRLTSACALKCCMVCDKFIQWGGVGGEGSHLNMVNF